MGKLKTICGKVNLLAKDYLQKIALKIKKHKIVSGIAIGVFALIGVPLLLNILVIGNNISSDASNDAWASFFGSYLGGIFGGVLTLTGVYLTIAFSQENEKNRRIQETKPIIAVGVNLGDILLKQELLNHENINISPTNEWYKQFFGLLSCKKTNSNVEKILSNIKTVNYLFLEIKNLKNIIREASVSVIYDGKIMYTCHIKCLSVDEKWYIPIDGVKFEEFEKIDFELNCFSEGNYWFTLKMIGNQYEESINNERNKIIV